MKTCWNLLNYYFANSFLFKRKYIFKKVLHIFYTLFEHLYICLFIYILLFYNVFHFCTLPTITKYIYIYINYLKVLIYLYIIFILYIEVFFMKYFYRVRKVNRRYTLEFKVAFDDDFSSVYSVILDNYRNTHNLHTTGLDYYGFIADFRVVGFTSVDQFSGWHPFTFSGSDDYFFVEFPTNFGYISKRGSFLRTGDYHLRANFRFQDFYSFIADNGKQIF